MRLVVASLTLLFTAWCGPAHAQICAQLQSQLAAAGAGVNAGATYQQQRAAYDAAYGQARQMGCITMFRIFAPPQCGPVLQNLDRLQAAIQGHAAATPVTSRAAIIAALQANGCTIGPAPNAPGRPRSETFRTVCVRPQDGYFFPISFATTADHFAADETACENQCVGASLFAYRNPGETIDDAIDIHGQRYVETPSAYQYRTSYNPAIRCSTSAAAIGVAVALPQTAPAVEPFVPVPLPRPVPSEDPDTLANRAGNLILHWPGESPEILMADGIRLIGPAFYYAQ